jgi:hypothetical protein
MIKQLLRGMALTVNIAVVPCEGYFCLEWETIQVAPNLYRANTTETQESNGTVVLFSHGWTCHHGCGGGLVTELKNMVPCYAFDYLDADGDVSLTSFGQKNEIAALSHAIEQVACLHPDAKIILHGISRGASTIITTLARLESEYLEKIGAAILESPYDSIQSVVTSLLQKSIIFSLVPGRIANNTVPLVATQYKPRGPRPISSIKKITRKDIPFLIICSREDLLVPWQSSAKLYLALLENNHSCAHILIVPNGPHGKACCHNLFAPTLHAFYKNYHLPHHENLAINASNRYNRLRPSCKQIEELKQKYPDNYIANAAFAYTYFKKILSHIFS